MISVGSKKTFAHGVHPPENKHTAGAAIQHFHFASMLTIPLLQHAGKAAIPVVREGQEVVRGQPIAKPDGFMSTAHHAPASGVIRKISLAFTANGDMRESIFLEPFPGSGQQIDWHEPPASLDNLTPDEIITLIQNSGMVGLGGAAFPTHVKFKIPPEKKVDVLVVNGVECEPYLTTDHRVMLEQQDWIFEGIRLSLKATGAGRAIIGVEANKMDAVHSLRSAFKEWKSKKESRQSIDVTVEALPVKYPQGAEKMLIHALLDRQVPPGGLPLDVGVAVSNVASMAEIGLLLPAGYGLIDRIVTITGEGVQKPGNYSMALGTPIRFALQRAGIHPDVLERGALKVVLGGPMMGRTAASLDVPLTKGMSGLLVQPVSPADQKPPEQPCIRCGQCLSACPMFLNPSRLGLLATAEAYESMRDEYHLMDCFECGSCSFVCPSHIPLVQKFRVAKGFLRDQKKKQAEA